MLGFLTPYSVRLEAIGFPTFGVSTVGLSTPRLPLRFGSSRLTIPLIRGDALGCGLLRIWSFGCKPGGTPFLEGP